MIFCLHVEFVFMLRSSQAAQAHYVWVRASEVIWSEYTNAKILKIWLWEIFCPWLWVSRNQFSMSSTGNRDISPLPLKSPKSFKPRSTIVFFVVVVVVVVVYLCFCFPLVDLDPWGVDSAKKLSRKHLKAPQKIIRDSAAFFLIF